MAERDVEIYTAAIEILRENVEKGFTPLNVLEMREQEFAAFKAQFTPTLGIPTIPEEEELPATLEEDGAKEKVMIPSALEIDIRSHSVKVFFGFDTINVTQIRPSDLKVLKALYQAAEEGLGSGNIVRIAKDAGSSSSAPSRDAIARLKHIDPYNEYLIEQFGGGGQAAKYRLNAGVEFVGLFEVDEQEVLTLSEVAQKLFFELRFASVENAFSSDELIRAVYGHDAEIDEARGKFSVLISNLRKKLEPIGIKIANATPRSSRKPGLYFLERTLNIETPASEEDTGVTFSLESDAEDNEAEAYLASIRKAVEDGKFDRKVLEQAEEYMQSMRAEGSIK